jgi:hypothetical protein
MVASKHGYTATTTMSCDDCFKTVAHSGTPVGRTETIAGVATYVSGTAQHKILLYFADVFGPFYRNSQLLQDWFAANGIHSLHAPNRTDPHIGFTVLGLDYFFGDRFETLRSQPGFVRETWRDKVVAQARECTPKWVEAVRQRYGQRPPPPRACADVASGTDAEYFAVGTPSPASSSLYSHRAGYCFGAPHVFALANDPTFHLAAGAPVLSWRFPMLTPPQPPSHIPPASTMVRPNSSNQTSSRTVWVSDHVQIEKTPPDDPIAAPIAFACAGEWWFTSCLSMISKHTF